MSLTIKQRFYASKFGFWIVYFISRILNGLTNLTGKYSKKIIPSSTLDQAAKRMKRLRWMPDEFKIYKWTFRHLWMRTAEYAQHQIDNGNFVIGDCDEWQSYAFALLKEQKDLQGLRKMTIRWILEDGSVEGHNTTVFMYPIRSGIFKDPAKTGVFKYGSLCTWGLRLEFMSSREIAEWFSAVNHGRLLAYCELSEDLKIRNYVRVK